MLIAAKKPSITGSSIQPVTAITGNSQALASTEKITKLRNCEGIGTLYVAVELIEGDSWYEKGS